jgi:two-component system, chemotaxis family, chemotaxis protein CheY
MEMENLMAELNEHKKRLLAVDDSKVSRMLLKAIVANLRPNWEITEATCGAEALTLMQSIVFDYIIADINMPGMDGLELLNHIRRDHVGHRVCLLSANMQRDTLEQAEALQAGFVRKPITEESVTAAVTYLEAAP